MTTSYSDCPIVLYLYKRACNYQLFTNEGSHRLPKRLNYCFILLANTTNELLAVSPSFASFVGPDGIYTPLQWTSTVRINVAAVTPQGLV